MATEPTRPYCILASTSIFFPTRCSFNSAWANRRRSFLDGPVGSLRARRSTSSTCLITGGWGGWSVKGENPPRIITVTQEIGERKRAEEHNSLLLGELDHRVKNILAVVSSVITQTLKTSDSPGAFAADIEGRIGAIARAHGRLTDDGRGAASLQELVATELAPYKGTIKNISIDGPPVEFTPKAGLALAMAIHELASNAAKYGALSKPTGVLSVTWQIENNSAGLLKFSWIEAGGPPISKPPSRRGFGTTLIERTLSHEFDATVKREFLFSGLKCSIAMPIASYLRLDLAQ
jgi:two-component system, chemotaxis family, CheB/CheR fusion protein